LEREREREKLTSTHGDFCAVDRRQRKENERGVKERLFIYREGWGEEKRPHKTLTRFGLAYVCGCVKLGWKWSNFLSLPLLQRRFLFKVSFGDTMHA